MRFQRETTIGVTAPPGRLVSLRETQLPDAPHVRVGRREVFVGFECPDCWTPMSTDGAPALVDGVYRWIDQKCPGCSRTYTVEAIPDDASRSELRP